jgi:hypothetical protein
MILIKKFTSKEILEILGSMVEQTLPKGSKGKLNLSYDDNGGVEVVFVEKNKTLEAVN